MTRLLAVELRSEREVVLARQRARQIAGLFGFDAQDQVRLATAVSEVARNAVQYAGGGRAEFAAAGRTLRVTVQDQGTGIPDLAAVLDGRYASPTGLGVGLAGTRRLMDEFAAESMPGGGTTVRFGKALPRGVEPPTGAALAGLAAELARPASDDPLAEVRRQNQELLGVLGDLRDREARLAEVNRELEETNRGVVALYAELEEKADSLRRASDLKSRFLSNMSHEFRTPLGSILSLAALLLDRADGPLTVEQEKQVQFVRRAALGLSELVNDLLDLAKVEAGMVVVRAEPVRAADLLAALRGMMRPLATNDAVALHIEDGVAAGELHSDEGKLAQVLRNFVSNALKFTERGEVRVTAAAGPGDTVAFAVADTGIGIAAADLPRVFEEFGQVEHPLQRVVKGTGLGLPLSRRLAALLGGRVDVESTVGVGSTFTLTVPRTYPHATDPRPAAGAPEPARPAVLVIDDDDIARYLLRGLLDPDRFVLLEAAGGEDGVRMALADRPRAVFLDLNMPGPSGFEVLDRLKNDPVTRDIPVVLYTSQVLGPADQQRLAGRTVATVAKGGKDGRAEAARQVRFALAAAGLDAPSGDDSHA